MSHRFTTSDGVAIAFERWGESNPAPVVVLHHGFAASANSNWEAPGAKPQQIAEALGDVRCVTFPGDHLGVIRQPGLAAAAVDFLNP